MIFHQAAAIVLQRVERTSGNDADLPHAAAEELAVPAGFLHRLLGSRQRGTNGSAESLAEADAHGVEVLAPGGRLDASRCDSVEQPGPVEMRP